MSCWAKEEKKKESSGDDGDGEAWCPGEEVSRMVLELRAWLGSMERWGQFPTAVARVGRGTVSMPPWPELDLAPWEGG